MVAGRDGLFRSLPSIDVATPKVRADQKVVYNPDDPDAMRVWLVHVQGLLDDKDLLHVAKYGVLSFADWSTSHDHNLDIADDSQSKVLIRMYHASDVKNIILNMSHARSNEHLRNMIRVC